jgi:hypothetical protein
LLGVKDSIFEVGSIDSGQFFISALVYHREAKFKFEIIGVYGPANHARSELFLQELEAKVNSCQHPVVVGGDFNLIRGPEDKSNDNINWHRVHLFNDCIANLALREIRRLGARFTWSNKQLNPIRSVLDRVLVSPEWEARFPLVTLTAETCIGSDHAPLILDSGEGSLCRSSRFFFETSWLSLPGFVEMINNLWVKLLASPGRRRDVIDCWQIQSGGLRQYLKGWGANRGKEAREAKARILAQILELDSQADLAGLDEDDWAYRYYLEEELMTILSCEEEYWRQRGRQNWLLDTSPTYL